jgi:hypothetical protein
MERPAGLVEDKDAPLAQRRLEHHLETRAEG